MATKLYWNISQEDRKKYGVDGTSESLDKLPGFTERLERGRRLSYENSIKKTQVTTSLYLPGELDGTYESWLPTEPDPVVPYPVAEVPVSEPVVVEPIMIGDPVAPIIIEVGNSVKIGDNIGKVIAIFQSTDESVGDMARVKINETYKIVPLSELQFCAEN